jgi:hypothetical protein
VTCAGCGQRAGWRRLAREPWLYLIDLKELDGGRGLSFCPECDDCAPDSYAGAVFLIWARGHVIVHARLELDAA